MDLKRLLQESFRRPTPAKVAMHLFKALTECDDATLISFLIEDDGSPLSADAIQGVLTTQPAQPPKGDTAYKSALSKKLMSKRGAFAEKVFEIFKGILNTTDHKGTLALMKQRPAVAQTAGYIIKLYDQYAQSEEVLDAMAAVKNDPPDTVCDALPQLLGTASPSMTQRVQKNLADLVKRDIAAVTIDFMQSAEAKNLAWGIPDGSDEVTQKDVDAAGGKHEAPPAKPAGKSDKPDFLISYVDYKDAIANRRMNLNELYTYGGWLTILSLVASHYERTLVKCLKIASTKRLPITEVPYEAKVYRFTKDQVPVGRDVEKYANEIASVGEPRVTTEGPSYHRNQIIAVNQLGPFYNLEALFRMAGGSVTHNSFYCCVLALEYLDDFIKNDLLKVKGSGTVRIKPVPR